MTDRQEVNSDSNESIRRALWKPRPPFFANWYLRNLAYQGYANRIGLPACWLLTCIAMKEDETRYAGPIDYFNGQLLVVCSFSSIHTLISAREKSKEHGLLYYEASVKRQAGIYFLCVPSHWPVMPGNESVQNGVQDQCAIPSRFSAFDALNPAQKGEGIAQPSIPIPLPDPLPDPLPKKSASRSNQFVAPTIEEVAAYCSKRGKGIDPEHFLAHYTANGWKQSSGQPVKDWKASVITWEKNQSRFKPAASLFGNRPSLEGTSGQVHQPTATASNDVSRFR